MFLAKNKNTNCMKNFKLFFISLLLCFFFGNLFSQNVGISSNAITPHTTSLLELRATNKGLLIPRVQLVSTSNGTYPIGNPANSLLVYNTIATGDVTPGFYYWNSSTSRWIRLLSGEINAWMLNGNTGTTPENNWLGTKDAQDFVIKTNNIERSRLLSAGNFLVNTTTAPIPVNATATAAFTTQVSGDYDVGIYGYGDDQNKKPIVAEQKNASGVAIYAINSAANGNGSGKAIVAYSNQMGGVAISAGLRTTVVTSSSAISAHASELIAGRGVTGVCNHTNGFGVVGESSGDNGIGILGIATGTVKPVGVFGRCNSSTGTGKGYAVYGKCMDAGGIGVYGENSVMTGSAEGCGVYGITTQSKGVGVYGKHTSFTGTAIAGVSYYSGAPSITPYYLLATGSGASFKAPKVGLFSWAYENTDTITGGAFHAGNYGLKPLRYSYVAYYLNGTSYKLYGTGTVSTVVNCPPEIRDKEKAIMFCPEAPEIVFQDYGVGQLKGGRARIDLDPILSHNIFVDETHPIKVFIQLEDECNGVYVANKSKLGFDVIELQSGKSNAKFSWIIIANRAMK